MLSGVGPAEHLHSNNISVIVDHPGVGQNLVDHPVVDLYFKDRFNASAMWLKPRSFRDVSNLISAVVRYFVLGKGGPLAMNVSTNLHRRKGLLNNISILSLVNQLHSFAQMIPSCSLLQGIPIS